MLSINPLFYIKTNLFYLNLYHDFIGHIQKFSNDIYQTVFLLKYY